MYICTIIYKLYKDMTSKIKLFVAATFVAMLATSCSEEQTSLTIEEIPGTAKVIGQVSYQTGTEWNATTSIAEAKYAAAANKKVIVEIQNSEFKSGAQGVTVYETTTDSKGNYEIEVPISKASMNVTIKAETFTGEMKMYDSMSTSTPSTPIYKTQYVTYSYSSTPQSVSSTTITVIDMKYTHTVRALLN